ncbi:pyruvate dehydrogenase (acetyl-transferring) E1 component subunit alpha [Roseivivax sp. CAU 1761]
MTADSAAAEAAREIPDASLIAAYRDMLLIRRFEEKAGQLYGMGLIGGYCHLYIGQEAVAVGLEASARDGDRRITSYRCHGLMLAAGLDPEPMLAELLGRAEGLSGGKGGSMHMYAPEQGFFGGHGILAAQVPIGAGLALAERTRRSHAVTYVYLGDAAADQGQVAETYALAMRWKLPVLFVIENNSELGGAAPLPGRGARGPGLTDRAKAHGIPARSVDGMDVLAVRTAAEDAALHVRAGKGPYLLEARTYRYRGHSMADPAKYRTRAEAQRVREARDPIAHLRALLLDGGHATEDELKAMDRETKERINAAAKAARDGAEPEASALHADVYAAG